MTRLRSIAQDNGQGANSEQALIPQHTPSVHSHSTILKQTFYASPPAYVCAIHDLFSCPLKRMTDTLTWVLARARAYSLAVLSSKGYKDAALCLDVSKLRLSAASMAWLREVPQSYVCCIPVSCGWTSFEINGVITYYRGNLATAEHFTMHLLRPAIHHYLRHEESAFVVLQDCKGAPLSGNILYFLNLEKPTETIVACLGAIDSMARIV